MITVSIESCRSFSPFPHKNLDLQQMLFECKTLINEFDQILCRAKLDGKSGDTNSKNEDQISSTSDQPTSIISINNNNNNNNNGGVTELHVQAKELRLELERKDAELRELHLTKLSLQVWDHP
jgi:hypothetical protein